MADAQPSKKSDLRKHWTQQHQRLLQYAQKDWNAMKLQGQPMWYQPQALGWSKDLFDLEGMSQSFDRQEQFDDFEKVVKDPSAPGCAGDFMGIQLQGDWLGTLERAFRERHKTWPRMMVHCNARRFGHQHDLGVLTYGQKNYLQWILRQTGNDRPA